MVEPLTRRTTLSLFALGGLAACVNRDPPKSVSAPLAVQLKARAGRSIDVSVWRAGTGRGTILFSHGALSSPAKYEALLGAWARAGYDVWAPLHVDSTDHPDTKSFPGLASWAARLEDMAELAVHIGARHCVAAGHSYGALVALTMGGAAAERPAGYEGPMRDRAVRAVVAFSPPGPAKGLIDEAGYALLAAPALIQTGTADVPPAAMGGLAGWRGHLAPFDSASPGGDRYALVLDGVDHYFGGIICRPELPGPRQTAQFKRALEVSRLFLEGFDQRRASAQRVLRAQLGRHGPGELFLK